MKTKNEKSIVIFIIAYALIAALGALKLWRANWYFMFTETIGRLGRHIDVKELKVDELHLETWNIEKMKKDMRFVFNQSLLLVNSENKLEDGFDAKVSDYKDSGIFINNCIFEPHAELADSVYEKFQQKLYIMSGYRTREEQAVISMTEKADTAAKEGSSEHQTGLALDVYVKNFAGDGFLKSKAGRYVNSHAYRYGFIIRYPMWKSRITGFRFEPWHIRYVGQPHATIIYMKDLTLEEYINSLKIGEFYLADGYIISRQSGDNLQIPSNCSQYVLSPDNMGNYIITAKRQ